MRSFARIHRQRTAARAGKPLTARIISPGARCTRLVDMCNAPAYPKSQPVGRTLDPQPELDSEAPYKKKARKNASSPCPLEP